MTKYWVLTMIGAIGLAALIHPERMRFLKSPAPWIAIVVLAILMTPHLIWLKQVDFVPLTYAGDVYGHLSRAQNIQLVIGYILHNAGLLAVPVALATLALAWNSRRWMSPLAAIARNWSRGPNPAVNLSQALNVWLIQIIVAVGPPLGALIFTIYMKTDWGISLFFLTPLALVAIPALRVPRRALFNIVAIWLADHAARAARLALDCRERDRAQSERLANPWRAFRAGARTDENLALAFRHALGGGGRHHRNEPVARLLQPRSSRAVYAGRSLDVGPCLAG